MGSSHSASNSSSSKSSQSSQSSNSVSEGVCCVGGVSSASAASPFIGSSASAYSRSSTGAAADPKTKAFHTKRREQMIRQLRKFERPIEEVMFYTRPVGNLSSSMDDADSGKSVTAVGGFMHTFMILYSGRSTYCVERFLEGMSICAIATEEDFQSVLKGAVLVLKKDISMTRGELADWIAEEALSEYSLLTNNCIQTVLRFGKKFTDEILFRCTWSFVRQRCAEMWCRENGKYWSDARHALML